MTLPLSGAAPVKAARRTYARVLKSRHTGMMALATMLAGVTAGAPAQAQDNDGIYLLDRLNRIVVTATRTPTRLEDVPLTVSLITDEQMADELVTDIRDLVRFEPGVSVQRQAARFSAAGSAMGRAGNDSFNIRGIGGNRVLIQVDGVRVPDGFSFGAQAAGRGDYVDLGLIKSVEILRGPSSALYGSDGLAGAVSFTTADPADFIAAGKSVGGLLRTSYNSADEEYAQTAIIAGSSGDWSAMAAYTRRDHKELETQGDVGGTGRFRSMANPQDGHSNAVLGRLVYEPGTGHKLRLTGEYLDTYLFTNGLSALSPTIELFQARDESERKRATLDWNWEGDGVIDAAHIAAYWQDGQDRQFSDEDRTPLADRERLNIFENRVIGLSADARADFATGAITHRLVFGGDVSETRQRGLRDGTVPPAGETYPTSAFPETKFKRGGLFVGDEIAVGGGLLTLYPALRFDFYKLTPEQDPTLPSFTGKAQDGSRLSPKLGAVLKLHESVRVFANYATGFKAPEPGQVNQFFENRAQGYISEPNPDLKPERSESFEGGVRLSSKNVSLDLTAFSARYRDFISQEMVGGAFTPMNPAIFQFVNLSRAHVKGAEARFEARASNGLNAQVAISYAKGNVSGTGASDLPLTSIDPMKLVVGVGYQSPDGMFGGKIIATHSARKSLASTSGLTATGGATTICSGSPCFRPDAFTILDATLFVKPFEGVTLRAGIFNILDQKYSWWSDVRGMTVAQVTNTASATYIPIDATTQPGRNASVSLSYRF